MQKSETKSFVTLFDSRYLARGLVLYESLKKYAGDFWLYIVAFDDKSYDKLSELMLERATIISLREFEDEELLGIKDERTKAEYCWSSTAKTILYVLDHYQTDACTYVDADLCFFDDPAILLEEISPDESVLITEHRYSGYCDQTALSGKYCVQFMTFKNNEAGRLVLNWWKDRCMEWCFARMEDGKFGDQKYLDDWCERFEGIHELKHLGGGAAPWNANQYSFGMRDERVFLTELSSNREYPLVFYHFHSLELFDESVVKLAHMGYRLPDTVVECVYKEYLKLIEQICQKYQLEEEKAIWKNESSYQSVDANEVTRKNNYYEYSLFVE